MQFYFLFTQLCHILLSYIYLILLDYVTFLILIFHFLTMIRNFLFLIIHNQLLVSIKASKSAFDEKSQLFCNNVFVLSLVLYHFLTLFLKYFLNTLLWQFCLIFFAKFAKFVSKFCKTFLNFYKFSACFKQKFINCLHERLYVQNLVIIIFFIGIHSFSWNISKFIYEAKQETF